jgi:hypothetical protein
MHHTQAYMATLQGNHLVPHDVLAERVDGHNHCAKGRTLAGAAIEKIE